MAEKEIADILKATKEKEDQDLCVLFHQAWLMKNIYGDLLTEITSEIMHLIYLLGSVTAREDLLMVMHDVLMVWEKQNEYTAIPYTFIYRLDRVDLSCVKSTKLVPYILRLCALLSTGQVGSDASHTIDYGNIVECRELNEKKHRAMIDLLALVTRLDVDNDIALLFSLIFATHCCGGWKKNLSSYYRVIRSEHLWKDGATEFKFELCEGRVRSYPLSHIYMDMIESFLHTGDLKELVIFVNNTMGRDEFYSLIEQYGIYPSIEESFNSSKKEIELLFLNKSK
jgi:hypothetical protein